MGSFSFSSRAEKIDFTAVYIELEIGFGKFGANISTRWI